MTTIPPPIRHAVHGVLLAALAFLATGVAPVRAASAVEIEGRALMGGRYEAGGWLAVAVTLVNEGTPTEGYVTAETESGAVRRYVEMPAGARKVVMLYLRPGGFQRQVAIRYEEPGGTVESTVPVRVLEVSGGQVAIVGDPNGAIRPQLAGAAVVDAPEPISLSPADLPERPEPLGGVASIVWAGDSGGLNEAQRRSIERWVADGGQLVVIGGADWQARTAGLGHLLPVEGLAASDGVDHGPLRDWAGLDVAPLGEDTIATGTLRDGARALVVAGDGTPIASWHAIGAGRVVLFGTDLTLDPYRGWDGSPHIWSRVLEGRAFLDEFFGRGFFPDDEQVTSSMARALNTLPSLDVPPAELLLAVILAYILLIGPVSYLVLRRIDRRELAWVTAPVLVVLFTACSYGIGVTLKGSDVIVNQIAVIRSSPGGTVASVEGYAGIYSPSRETYDLLVDADALVARMSTEQFFDGRGLDGGAAHLTSEQGDPARLRDLPITAGGFEYVRADGIVPHAPRLAVTWSSRGGDLVGTVTNVGEGALSDVAYVSTGGGEMVGSLEPGQSAEFVVDRRNLNQSAASDQVYGFGGFDTADPERRRIATRRGVIDALVGYGGWIPIDAELTGFGGRGPYVIGWQSGEGPMPIAVEGVEAQRFAEVVEVVSVRPGIGPGNVVIGPGQMGVTVTTEGAASVLGPGIVSLGGGGAGGGSATFNIALPLEASGLAVDELEIVAGSEPMMVIEDPGVLRGFWPPGYRIEVRDVRSGGWIPLGDLGDANRFVIDEPAAAVSATGRIEVRVTAGDVDPNFGEPSIFVSARAGGVIEP